MYFSKSVIFVVLCVVASPIYIHGWPSNKEISCRTKGFTLLNELMLYPSKTSKGKDSSNNLKSPYLLDNKECYATINAPIDSGIMVSIENFDLRPNNIDKLSITYKPNARSATLQTKWYSNMASVQWKERNKDVIYSAGNVRVYFETGNKRFGDFNSYKGFELVYTVVRNSTFMLGCTRTEFSCRNGICISKELRCDGYNHCGDRSGQENCDFYIKREPMSLGRKIGIGFGTVFFLIAVALGIYLLIRRRQSTVTTTTIYGGYPQGQY